MISTTAPVRVNFFKQSMMRNRIRASKRAFGLLALCAVLVGKTLAAGLDSSVQQLIVSVAADWDASTGKLQLFERTNGAWKADGPAIPVLYGKSGLVWGRGIYGTDEPGTHKQEHDGRAPAGVFKIGTIYTYDPALPSGAKYPFHTVGSGDAWVDDINSPDYNKQVTVDPANPPPWFEKQKMRHGDFAYRWLVEIRHNSDPPVPNGGSAIFFHIRRGPARKTAGCTTMAEDDLVKLIRWLRADKHPHYALLPRSEYEAKWKAWGLPSPQEAAAVMP
jgi:L,D-peptidoglycan transpeptidase YkuD (ErfK/YbiS/YcfS/YnhG family)